MFCFLSLFFPAPVLQLDEDEDVGHPGRDPDDFRCGPEGDERVVLQGEPRLLLRVHPHDHLRHLALWVRLGFGFIRYPVGVFLGDAFIRPIYSVELIHPTNQFRRSRAYDQSIPSKSHTAVRS